MSIVNSEIAAEGILLEVEDITIPRSLYEHLIRAETERDVLEAVIKNDKYDADTVLRAILVARDSYNASKRRCIQAGIDEEQREPTEDVSEDA